MIYERETIYGWGYLHVRGGRLSMGVEGEIYERGDYLRVAGYLQGGHYLRVGISTRGTHLRAGDYLHVRGGRLSTGVGGMICEGGDYLRAGGYLHVRGGRLSMGRGISTRGTLSKGGGISTRGETMYGRVIIYMYEGEDYGWASMRGRLSTGRGG